MSVPTLCPLDNKKQFCLHVNKEGEVCSDGDNVVHFCSAANVHWNVLITKVSLETLGENIYQ